MDFNRRIAGLLHDEHVQTMGVLERFESALHDRRKATSPNPDEDVELAQIMRQIRPLAETEMPAHFAFEEAELFPRLAEFGDAAMGGLLEEEHRSLRATATSLAEISAHALADGFTPEQWSDFKRLGGEFVETMTGHIQKEEMGLLFALEAMLDEDGDEQLVAAYMATR